MKNVALSPLDSLIKNTISAVSELNVELNKSELTLDDYQELLFNQFSSHVQPVKFDVADYRYCDGYIISKLKKYLGTIKAEAEAWKSFLRAYKVTLVHDRRGFYFEQIIFPRSLSVPLQDTINKKMNSSYSDSFNVNMTVEKLRTVFRLTPTPEAQLDLMKSVGIPLMAMSLGLELSPDMRNFEIFFCWDENSRIDSDGCYKELEREQPKEN
jgi:hypothetical protein